jgi:F0F1-type ATP synthase delta subunit
VFHRSRWARVFADGLGKNADAGLAYLKALVPPIQTIPDELSGRAAALRLEKILRESAAAVSSGDSCPASEQVIRFISLLVEKKHFGNIDAIMEKIEEILDRRSGILTVTAETATPMDGALEEELKGRIAQAAGASKVKMKTRQVASLLGGYRLQIGGFYIDASLKGQVEKMKTMLEEAVLRIDAPPSPEKGMAHG